MSLSIPSPKRSISPRKFPPFLLERPVPIAIRSHDRRARAGPLVAPRVDGLVVRSRTASEHSPSARTPDEPISVFPGPRRSPATYPFLTPADVRRRESTMGTWSKTFARPAPPLGQGRATSFARLPRVLRSCSPRARRSPSIEPTHPLGEAGRAWRSSLGFPDNL